MHYNHEKESLHAASEPTGTAAIMQKNHPDSWGSSSGPQLGGQFLLSGIQHLLMHWQCPADLAALGICCKLVKAVCLQATLIYPRVSVRHLSNHRSRKRLAWFLLFSPNPQMHFVLSDNGRSTEPEAETPGQCKHCCKPVGVAGCGSVGKKGRGWEEEKGTEKGLKGLCIMQCFGAKSCCCFSKAAAFQLETGDTHHPQSPTSDSSQEFKSIHTGFDDSTLPPAGLHTSALALSQSSDIMHYLARRCF